METICYAGDVFTPINFGLLLLGTIGGLILGATPGLSPTMTNGCARVTWAARMLMATCMLQVGSKS